MISLNYRCCVPRDEPAVVHVDQCDNYNITPIAVNFYSFIRGLR
jgi:hypothetical protein